MNRRRLLLIIAVAGLSVALAATVTAIAVRGGKARATAVAPALNQRRPDEQTRYVGVSADRHLAIAVIVWQTSTTGYIADGSGNQVLLKAADHGDRLQMKSADGVVLDGEVKAGMLRGTVTKGQASTSFALPAAKPPAGLYRATGPNVRFWLIVLPDGRQAGTQSVDGRSQVAPDWDLRTGTIGYQGARLQVQPVTPGDV
jgi:hypothetical protein